MAGRAVERGFHGEFGRGMGGLVFFACICEGDGAFGADAAGGDAPTAVAEDEALSTKSVNEARQRDWWYYGTYGNDIEEAKHEDDDPRADNNSPECHAQILLTCCRLIQVTKYVDAEHNHGYTKSAEAVDWAEHRPVSCEVGLEERAFGDDEESC